LAEQRRVQLREYNVIYDAVSEMRAALEGLLKPIETEVVLGKCEVRQLFSISRYGTIAGCFVLDGVVRRTAGVHLIRDGQRVWTGRTASLQRFKDDVREVREGFECGLRLEGRDDLKPGDIVEFFTVEQVARKLEDTGKATAKT
jgi:translation initiation factor IF-2